MLVSLFCLIFHGIEASQPRFIRAESGQFEAGYYLLQNGDKYIRYGDSFLTVFGQNMGTCLAIEAMTSGITCGVTTALSAVSAIPDYLFRQQFLGLGKTRVVVWKLQPIDDETFRLIAVAPEECPEAKTMAKCQVEWHNYKQLSFTSPMVAHPSSNRDGTYYIKTMVDQKEQWLNHGLLSVGFNPTERVPWTFVKL